MTQHAGIWIDHRQAIVVTIADEAESTSVLESRVERRPGRTGGARPARRRGARSVVADDSIERRFRGELDGWYDRVIASVRTAATILILGPGEAKGELKKRLERHGRERRPITVEPADKMTTAQVAARLRTALRPGRRVAKRAPSARVTQAAARGNG